MRLVLIMALLSAGCSVSHRVEVFPHGVPKEWICGDGLPVKVIQDVRCTSGICGYTCEPERWVTK
jgi:hypothetical protein